MGTLSTVMSRARVNARDVNKLKSTDAQYLGIVNDILEQIYGELCGIESVLVYKEGSITLAADTPEYTPSFSFNSIMDDGMWIDGEETFLFQGSEADKIHYDVDTVTAQPEAFYITEDNKIGFLSVPDQTYTVYCQYFEPLTELADVTNDAVPWQGIWDSTVQHTLTATALDIQERPSAKWWARAAAAHGTAMATTYARGIRRRRAGGDLFRGVSGI